MFYQFTNTQFIIAALTIALLIFVQLETRCKCNYGSCGCSNQPQEKNEQVLKEKFPDQTVVYDSTYDVLREYTCPDMYNGKPVVSEAGSSITHW